MESNWNNRRREKEEFKSIPSFLYNITTMSWHCRHYMKKKIHHSPCIYSKCCLYYMTLSMFGQSYSVRLASHVCGWEWWIMYTNFYQNLFDSLVTFNLYTSAFKVWAYCSYHVMNETRLLLLNDWSACGYSSLLLPIIITVHYYVKANTFVMRM